MVQRGLSHVIAEWCGVSWFVFHKLFNTTVENFMLASQFISVRLVIAVVCAQPNTSSVLI